MDELSGQIDQRQIDLAQFAEQHSPCKKKGVRSCGSTESLKPKDDGEAHPGANGRISAEETLAAHQNAQRISGLTNATTQRDQSGADEAHSSSSSAVERQRPQVQAAAMAKARAALRRSQLGKKRGAADSLVSGDGQAVVSKYRSKTLVVVYYDSYVQSFFEEVVKFVSASRNLTRKAKMAAKVAQIKRMAELDVPDDDSSVESDEGYGNGTAKFLPPQLSPSAMQTDGMNGTNGDKMECEGKSIVQPAITAEPENRSTNGVPTTVPPTQKGGSPSLPRMNGTSSPTPLSPGNFRPSLAAWSPPYNSKKQPPGILDELDKGLEFVQSMCEQAAHQFLRDGDCSDEIVKIQERLTTTRASADKELERMLENDADGSMKNSMTEGGSTRNRTYRPHILRRDMAGGGPSPELQTRSVNGHRVDDFPRANSNADGVGLGHGAELTLEVDDGVNGDAAGGDRDQGTSKFEFRSTRTMGRRITTGH